jgi:hypothetical protein
MPRRAILVLAAVSVFSLTGCIGLDLSRDTVASQAAQWEYLTVRPESAPVAFASDGGAQTDPQLSQLGTEGWELVAVNDGAYILKRPKPK